MEKLLDFANKKEIYCRIRSRAYSLWLTRLTPVNIILVVGGAILSLIAGSSLLINQEFISNTEAGIMALISAGFGIVHKTLNCDHHQAECKKLKTPTLP